MTDDRLLEDVEAKIDEIAGLDEVAYQLNRKGFAAMLDIGVVALDKVRTRRRAELYASSRAVDGSDGEQSTPFSDDDVALTFIDENGHRLRYDKTRDCWMIYDSGRWRPAKKSEVLGLIRETCRRIADTCHDFNMRRMLLGARVIEAAERLARSDPRIAATADQFDADPLLLNTPGGVVDLRIGEMRSHRPDYYMTRMAAVGADIDMAMPQFAKFLATVTGGDRDLQEYLQRLCGYGLTGLTNEHVVAFFYGAGGNGKTTFLETVAGIMGDYHATAVLDMFIASKNDRHPTEIADLRGARLTSSTETSEGRRWDEAKLKVLTGGDTIKARLMHKDFFAFVPQFTLIIAGNHKPALGTVDAAIRRRMHVVPFTIEIPDAEKDPELKEKLRAEWPAILDWMIQGCLDWQERGLDPPSAVIEATQDYLEAEDTMAAWLAERCTMDPNAWSSCSELFDDYERYCRGRNEFIGAQKSFSEKLGRREGISPHRTNVARGFNGVSLKTATAALQAHSQRLAASHASPKKPL